MGDDVFGGVEAMTALSQVFNASAAVMKSECDVSNETIRQEIYVKHQNAWAAARKTAATAYRPKTQSVPLFVLAYWVDIAVQHSRKLQTNRQLDTVRL